MRIRILQGIEGAKAATGVAVIIDVFRAFTVESILFRNGAARVVPIASLEEAYAWKERDPSAVLVGERGGAIQPGFDFGNSPSQVAPVDFTGKTVVHTTSAGTQGIAGAAGADRILAAALVNAGATARRIRSLGAEDVSLVCMGLAGLEETAEDTLCARVIRDRLEGRAVDVSDEIADLARTSGAKFFDPARQSVFPRADFALCTALDTVDFALEYSGGEMRPARA